jgi:hypothetical protein
MRASDNLPYPADTTIQELGASERLMLMTLRLWAMPHRQPDKPVSDWRNGLYHCGAGDQACVAMEAFLNILLSYSERLMDVRCTCNTQLGFDEGCFLQILAFLQHDRHAEAQAILADWVPLPVQGMALICAIHLAESLRKAGVLVPLFQRQPAKVIPFQEFQLKRNRQNADACAARSGHRLH